MQPQFDTDEIKSKLAQIREIMLTDTDLVLLGEYRKIFKKEFSIFRRSWAAAWLLMYFDKNGAADPLKSLPKNVKKNDEPCNFLDEEESKRLFISIGRNRHLYPKELLALICSKAMVPVSDIGAVRILDNYSFVQVRANQAQRIIEALNGLQFRGRTLAVNYARLKSEEAAEYQPMEIAFGQSPGLE